MPIVGALVHMPILGALVHIPILGALVHMPIPGVANALAFCGELDETRCCYGGHIVINWRTKAQEIVTQRQ